MRGVTRFEELVAKISNQISIQELTQPFSLQIGRRREELALKALSEMREEWQISDFVRTGIISFSAITRGINFYLIVIGEAERITIPLSVTGKWWARNRLTSHPGVPVLVVDEWSDDVSSVRAKISEIIRSRLKH